MKSKFGAAAAVGALAAFYGAAMGGILIVPVSAAEPASEPVLQVTVSGPTQTVTRSDLRKHLRPVKVTVYNPAYKRLMTYEGFWLDQVLRELKMKLGDQDLVFICADGYGNSLSAGEIGRKKWLVAYGEPEGWTPLPERTPPALPGPWYVVGNDPKSYQEFPWPYQVIAIKVRGDW